MEGGRSGAPRGGCRATRTCRPRGKVCGISGDGLAGGLSETGVPKWRLAVSEVLTFPGDDVEDVKDAVVSPIVVDDTVEHGLRGKRRWEGFHQRFPQDPRSEGRVRHCKQRLALPRKINSRQKILSRRWVAKIFWITSVLTVLPNMSVNILRFLCGDEGRKTVDKRRQSRASGTRILLELHASSE